MGMLEPWLDPMVGLIVLPLCWGSLAFVLGPGRGAGLALLGLGLQAGLVLQLALALMQRGPLLHAVGGWGAPLGIDLYADGLAALMLLLTQGLALLVALYARVWWQEGGAPAMFWPLLGFLHAGLNALFLSSDLFNLYVTLELVGLASVGLVALSGGAKPLAAALRYLWIGLIASGVYLLGVALIYASFGTVALATLAPLWFEASRWVVGLPLLLMILALLAKTAAFPFHIWLPPAHGGAPAPISALLSAVVIKASFYLLLRLWLSLGSVFDAWLAWGLAGLGMLAILWGSFQALRVERLKMLIAWSTVAQVGYLFLIFPLLEVGTLALQAGMLQLIAHGLAKAAMFASAGVLVRTLGDDRLEGLSGVVAQRPVSVFALGLAGVSLMGLPPSGGFLAKWLLLEAALAQGAWLIALVVIVGGLLAAGYMFRILRLAFLQPEGAGQAPPVPRLMEWLPLGLALGSVLLGLRAGEVSALLALGGGHG